MTIFKLYPRSCERAREWASLRLDGELSEFEQALFGAHLERCADCARFAGAVGTTTSALREAVLERLSEPVALPLRSRRALPLRAMSVAAAAAAVAAAVGLGTLFGSLGTTRRPIVTDLSRSAVSSEPVGEAALIQQPRLAMLKARIGAAGPQRGIGIADL
jgi:predicted anti-sigma-YlaC factor YlaD